MYKKLIEFLQSDTTQCEVWIGDIFTIILYDSHYTIWTNVGTEPLKVGVEGNKAIEIIRQKYPETLYEYGIVRYGYY